MFERTEGRSNATPTAVACSVLLDNRGSIFISIFLKSIIPLPSIPPRSPRPTPSQIPAQIQNAKHSGSALAPCSRHPPNPKHNISIKALANHVQRARSHTPDQKTLPAKRNCDGHPALCAPTLFGEKMFITPKAISNISGPYSHDLAVTASLATAPRILTADHTDHTDKNI
jgi:hypothetical protein